MKKSLFAILFFVGLTQFFSFLSAKDHQILMRDEGGDGAYVMEPGYLFINPGDTVTFVGHGEKGHSHNVRGLVVPKGEEMNHLGFLKKGMTWTYKPTKEGVYVYECVPHPGMIGIIQVGKAVNAMDLSDINSKSVKFKQEITQQRFKKYAENIK